MTRFRKPGIILKARRLRRNQTEEEIILWRVLRRSQINNIHFRRQHPIGHYIVDFCAYEIKLIIELDGGHHLEQIAYDDERTTFLQENGFTVLRFWNHEIKNDLDAVIKKIKQATEES